MARELIVLGTASQVPTRTRSHNGYLLRWDDQGILFDPGEGAQRQLLLAGAAASDITRICLTHFHGDHCLGVPGIVQRISLDGAPHEVVAHYPASGKDFFARLRHASIFYDVARIAEQPIHADGELGGGLTARRLNHPVESYGYRLSEPDGRRMLPERLAALGIHGPAVGELQREGSLKTQAGRTVHLDEVSEPKRGKVFAFVMDTGWCDAAFELAADADMLVIESTFLEPEAAVAEAAGHLTAAQAGRIAAQAGARKLVLTHFSQRYTEPDAFGEEASRHYTGEIIVAEDLMRITIS
jgi:ribonuclease Z